jgi:CelD/BcsL family acetyltransferase involved in cellulose biosynthesis
MPAPVAADAWSVEVRRDDDCLPGLAAEWSDLVARCPAATPFQSHAWLESWWHTYGVPGRLRLVLVRHGGRLVAAAPLMLERRWLCAVLTPLGGALSDFTDVLVDEEVAADASWILAAAMLAQRDWHVLDVREARPGAVAGGALLRTWPGPHREIRASLCLELPATPMAELVRQLPSHTRKTVRRRLNQISRLDIDVRALTPDESDRAVADLLRLHELQWRGRGVNPAHLRPQFRHHLARATRAMIGAGEAALLEYRIGDRLVASSLVIVGPDLAGGYLYGADPELRDRVDVTTLLLASTLDLAHRRGCATLSMLRGAEPYKARWRPREAVNQRILLARPDSARARAYMSGVRARCAVVDVLRQRMPWLRGVRDGVHRIIAGLRP